MERYVKLEKGREIYCVLLINLIEYTFKRQQYDYTEVLLTQLDLLSTDYKEFFHRTVYKFFSGLLLIKRGPEQEGRDLTQKMLQIMRDLNQDSLAELYSQLVS
ncbi:hypothetical protein IGJ74_002582 [Enterococcus sp. AZ009]